MTSVIVSRPALEDVEQVTGAPPVVLQMMLTRPIPRAWEHSAPPRKLPLTTLSNRRIAGFHASKMPYWETCSVVSTRISTDAARGPTDCVSGSTNTLVVSPSLSAQARSSAAARACSSAAAEASGSGSTLAARLALPGIDAGGGAPVGMCATSMRCVAGVRGAQPVEALRQPLVELRRWPQPH